MPEHNTAQTPLAGQNGEEQRFYRVIGQRGTLIAKDDTEAAELARERFGADASVQHDPEAMEQFITALFPIALKGGE